MTHRSWRGSRGSGSGGRGEEHGIAHMDAESNVVPLKVVIVGHEHAGKTTFATRLGGYAVTRPTNCGVHHLYQKQISHGSQAVDLVLWDTDNTVWTIAYHYITTLLLYPKRELHRPSSQQFDATYEILAYLAAGHTIEPHHPTTLIQSVTLRRQCYEGAHCIIILYSTVQRNSFEHIASYWHHELHTECARVPLLLVGNKIDLRDGHAALGTTIGLPVTYEEAQMVADMIGAKAIVECSALDGDRYDAVLDTVIDIAVEFYVQRSPKKCTIQ